MTTAQHDASVVPFAVDDLGRAPKQRYFDEEFFRLETDRLWSRTWQMACRLEEIPEPFDYTTYEILGESVIVVRGEDGTVSAHQNTCRHRGVRLVTEPGRCETGFTCSFHGWCYGADGANTFVPKATSFSDDNLDPVDVSLVRVRCETWGGCAWINLDETAPPLLESIEPFASIMDAWKLESLHPEWWVAVRLPVNWKLAEEAFMEQYHVIESHPQLVDPARFVPKNPDAFDARRWLEAELRYLRTMSEGMAGMVHATDVAVAERVAADIDLPADAAGAMATWHRAYNDAVTEHHRSLGHDAPDMNALADAGTDEPMGYCFPHFFVLPMYSSASSYRFRPVGPEETLMEIWSLTRFPDDHVPEKLAPPEVWECDDPRIPPIPQQDFSNLPRQQLGLHAGGFEFMRFSERAEGGIVNMERLVDGYIAGLSHEHLHQGRRVVNVNPLEQPTADLGFSIEGDR